MEQNTERTPPPPSSSEDEKKKATQKVSFFKLFTFADKLDITLMIIGTIFSVANGLANPIMIMFFGKLINTFGSTDPAYMIHEVSKVALIFVYLAFGIGISSFLQVSCWIVTGERQAARIRSLYLNTILKQDIAFFDTETTTGEVIGRMSGDTILIQDAMGEKVASFTGEKKAIEMYNIKLRDAYNTMVQQELASGVGMGALMLVFYSSYAFAMWYGSKLVIEKGYNGGTVINIIISLMNGGMSLGQTSPSLNAFAAGQAAAYKMFETIKRKPKIDAYDTNGVVLEDIKGDIELRDVDFSYPARPDEKIFAGFSLYVPRGTTAALVGQSGSGKSTVISLLERFYDPDAGEVLIDASIRENISYGKEGATDEEINTAITLSNAKKFIDKLPLGLDTMAGEHGTQLSGGQKQRIAIARAILKNPRILLLDEATSALDAESERIVQEALERVMSNRTTVVVAHRLTTIRHADIIAVVHKGKIVEQGTHDELTKDPEGAFSQLIRLQEGEKEGEVVQNSEADKSNNNINSERIRSVTFEKVVHQEITWFDDPSNSSGAVGARLSNDASTVKTLVGNTLALIVQNTATVTAGLVIAFTANWILAFIILAVSPIILIQGVLQMRFLKGFNADAKVKYEEASQVANDAVGSIRTVAAFCAEPKVMDMYRNKCAGPEKQGVKVGLISGIGFGFSFFAVYCTNAFCFYIGSILVQHGKATFPEVFKVLTIYFVQVFISLTVTAISVSQTSSLASDTNKAKESAASIFEILDRKPAIDSSSSEGTTLETVVGNIELQHVSFKYPTRPDIQVLKDLCLTIPAGKTVALVGESGCGKSTIISLLERFYNPDSGQVLIDGVDIKKFRLSWLRQQMGLVGQEPILFNESIYSNIAYGKEGATESEIVAAAQTANAHKFISSLPNGYDTCVGEKGTHLSGGQKQRIAIARAMLKDPKILLLDEATSALDEESQHIVQDALDRVSVNRTTVVVAHRLTTIKGADIIAVMVNGVVAEKGRHEALVTINDGVYASMVALHKSAS
ncbi:unnamed protein product [Lupinus luteus]|uniref:Uncharacterized protein n=1 Tax=Lupinus luteus TaxID=3873 RepID=A0AAV1VW85_LUPLU